MRVLVPAPHDFVDPASGQPAFGSYAGPLPRVCFDAGWLRRSFERKRWVFVAIVSERIWLSLAVVDTGYAGTAFAYVFDRRSRRMLVDRTVLGPPRSCVTTDDFHADGEVARFRFGRTRVSLERRAEVCVLVARLGEVDLDVSFDARAAPPAVSAIADLGEGRASATEKRALARAKGRLVVGTQAFALDEARVGYDYTNGLLPRRTRWKWAFGMGRTREGREVAFNVVEGFVGAAECAVFVDGRVHPLGEPRFSFDADAPRAPWQLIGGGLDLRFDVGAIHAQHTNLGLVRSRFLQPIGAFTGTVRCGGVPIAIDGLPGVVEDQDVVW